MNNINIKNNHSYPEIHDLYNNDSEEKTFSIPNPNSSKFGTVSIKQVANEEDNIKDINDLYNNDSEEKSFSIENPNPSTSGKASIVQVANGEDISDFYPNEESFSIEDSNPSKSGENDIKNITELYKTKTTEELFKEKNPMENRPASSTKTPPFTTTSTDQIPLAAKDLSSLSAVNKNIKSQNNDIIPLSGPISSKRSARVRL
jgi:hypothetical protein